MAQPALGMLKLFTLRYTCEHIADQHENRARSVRNFRPRKNVLDELDDSEPITRYRLDKEGIMFVTDILRGAMESPTRRSTFISSQMKVLITLHFLATGKMQLCNGNELDLRSRLSSE